MTHNEPDVTDYDEPNRYAFCATCAKETVVVKRDFGTG
jgi:hypothetical protein